MQSCSPWHRELLAPLLALLLALEVSPWQVPEQGEALNVPSGMHSAPLCCLAAGRRGPSPCHLHPTASVTLPGAGGGGRESEMWQGESGKRKERRKPDVGESIRRGGKGGTGCRPRCSTQLEPAATSQPWRAPAFPTGTA